jgi:predicted enzyme related to lactoylglutathione lyase
MALRHTFTVIDCNDLDAMTSFWSELTGLEPAGDAPGYRWLRSQAEGASLIAFQVVPESKQGKNRVHLDLQTDDVLAEVGRAMSLGATEVDRHAWEDYHWVVMHDPEGNEFCIASGGTAPW